VSLVEYKEKKESLNGEQQRLLNKFLEDFERNGLALSSQKRSLFPFLFLSFFLSFFLSLFLSLSATLHNQNKSERISSLHSLH
jgi:hypothetical protein